MNTMLKAVCIFVLIVCIGALIWSIINTIRTQKKNKATDEANRIIFMSKMNQLQADGSMSTPKPVQTSSGIHPQIVPSKPVNYEKKEEDIPAEPEVDISGLKLKDFYGPKKN